MDTYTWEEIFDLVDAYYKAVENEDEETMVHISNVLPDFISLDC